jgi:ubiquinone/menaquinone biosynthesis C-methylase UbiE
MGVEQEELFAKRATSFGAHAGAYTEHRPDYPMDGIRWVLAASRRPVREVLDLAAGTGKLTDGLLSIGLSVTAVEPDPGMLAELARRLPSVTALSGTAERIPLPDASVDAVLAGQAFHWFDVNLALGEVARVLRPGGVVGALWNHDDVRVEWVAGLAKLNRTAASGRAASGDGTGLAHPAFGPFEQEYFSHSQRRTIDSMIATIGTHSHTLVVSERERAELFERMRAYLSARPETASGEFELPIRTTVVRSARTPGAAREG